MYDIVLLIVFQLVQIILQTTFFVSFLNVYIFFYFLNKKHVSNVIYSYDERFTFVVSTGSCKV